jgi:hypothetical protein
VRDARPWTYAALFGTLWGAIEATLGTAMYLSRLPMRGTVMGIAGLLCLVCLRRLQPRLGVCLLAGVAAIFVKIFTLGGFYTGPIIGMGVEAIAVEIAMAVTGGTAIGAALGGAVTLATNPFQKLLKLWVVAGTDGVRAYVRLFQESAAAFGIEGVRPGLVVAGIVAVAGAVGAAGGLWAWWVSGRVLRRLGIRS